MKIEATSSEQYQPVLTLSPQNDEDEDFLKRLGETLAPHDACYGKMKHRDDLRWGMNIMITGNGELANRRSYEIKMGQYPPGVFTRIFNAIFPPKRFRRP